MKPSFKSWLKAFRLHTLPLALASIGMGNIMAFIFDAITPAVLIMSFITAIMLQVLSNLANDYGDTKHGADSKDRVGPVRTMQSGEISKRQMKRAIVICSLLSLFSGSLLLVFSYKNIGFLSTILFFLIGIGAIWAAYSYTASDKPYGYRGLGDFFVFIFFGVVSVFGTYYLQTGRFNSMVLPASIAMGFLSVAVLNLNNIRDIESDRKNGKITISVKLGLKYALLYHAALILISIVMFILIARITYKENYQYLFLITLSLLIFNMIKTFNAKSAVHYYSLLKQLSLFTMLTVILFFIGYIVLN